VGWGRGSQPRGSSKSYRIYTWDESPRVGGPEAKLASSLLGNVALDGFRRDVAGGGDKIGASPERSHALEVRIFLAQDPRGGTFEPEHGIRGRKGGRTTQEQVDVIRHDFERQDIAVQVFGFEQQQFSQISFDRADQDFLPSFRAPDEVKIEQRNRRFGASITLTHRHTH
jgi:hypothetical protein